MQSLHTRLDPIKEEVLDVVKKRGRFKAMQRYGVADYGCFSGWIEDVSGDPLIGLQPQISPGGSRDLLEDLLYAMLRKVAKLEAEKRALEEENVFLRADRDRRNEIEQNNILAVIQKMEA